MEFYTDDILTLVKKKMREQGAYGRDAYKQFVSETIEYYKEKGKIVEDDNYEAMEDALMDMWPDIEHEFAHKE